MNEDQIARSSASLYMGKEYLGIKGAVGRGKEKSMSSGKTRSMSEKAFVIDLIRDDEDSPQKKSGDMEKNVGVERRLVKTLQDERIETQCMETITREILGKMVELEFALKEENTLRIRAELAFNVERQRGETVEHELEEAKKSTEKVQNLFAEEKRMRLSQEKLRMEYQRSIEHRNRETTVKSLASIAEQYIDILESGCEASDVKSFEIAKASTTSKMWAKLCKNIHGLGAKSDEMSKKPGLIEHRDYLEEALLMEK